MIFGFFGVFSFSFLLGSYVVSCGSEAERGEAK